MRVWITFVSALCLVTTIVLQTKVGLWMSSSSYQTIMDEIIATTAAGDAQREGRQPPSYKLATEQSYGFFDDVPDEQWKRAQRLHARQFPNYYVPGNNLTQYANSINDKGNYGALRQSNWWNAQNFQVEFQLCSAAQRLPPNSVGDGAKVVCDPHRIARQPSCLVYSVGSNGDVSFERAVREEIGPHCEIHTFDPGRRNKRNGDFADALRGYATFHNWALGTEEEAQARPNQVKTLGQTIQELGHVDRRIDVFKIDCEWCEWTTYTQWLEVGTLRQILVETHNAPLPNARNFFFSLHDAGYVIFNKECNYRNAGGGVEFAFLKLNPTFFINDTLYSKL